MPKFKYMFETLDVDGSGEISLEEIESAPEELKDDLRKIVKADDLGEIFRLMDDDDSNSVNIDEFLDVLFKASQCDIIHKLQMRRLVQQSNVILKFHRSMADTWPPVVPGAGRCHHP